MAELGNFILNQSSLGYVAPEINIERIISSDLLVSDLKNENNLITLNTKDSICIANIDIRLDELLQSLLIPNNIRKGVTILGVAGTYEGQPDTGAFIVTYIPSLDQVSWTSINNATYNIYYQRSTINTFPNTTGTSVISNISNTYLSINPPSSTTTNYYYWYGVSYIVDGVESDIIWDTENSKYVEKSTTIQYYTQNIYNYNDKAIIVSYGTTNYTLAAGANQSFSIESGTGVTISISASGAQLSASYGAVNESKTKVDFIANINRNVYIYNETYSVKVYNNCSSTPITFYGYSINAKNYKILSLPRGTSVTIMHNTKPIIDTNISGGNIAISYLNNYKTLKFNVVAANTEIEIAEYILEYDVNITLSGTPGNVEVKDGYSLSNVSPTGATYLTIYHPYGDDFYAPEFSCFGCETQGWYQAGISTDDEGFETVIYELKIYNFTDYNPTITFYDES